MKHGLEARRKKVLVLHLRRVSETDIAATLEVSQSTVSRDLDWTREYWRYRYGTPADVDVAAEVGEAIAVFEAAESAAFRQYDALVTAARPHGSSLPSFVRQQLACLKTAMAARELRLNLLQHLGCMNQNGGVPGTLSTADDIRAGLRTRGLLSEDADPPFDRENVAEDYDEQEGVERWLTGQ